MGLRVGCEQSTMTAPASPWRTDHSRFVPFGGLSERWLLSAEQQPAGASGFVATEAFPELVVLYTIALITDGRTALDGDWF